MSRGKRKHSIATVKHLIPLTGARPFEYLIKTQGAKIQSLYQKSREYCLFLWYNFINCIINYIKTSLEKSKIKITGQQFKFHSFSDYILMISLVNKAVVCAVKVQFVPFVQFVHCQNKLKSSYVHWSTRLIIHTHIKIDKCCSSLDLQTTEVGRHCYLAFRHANNDNWTGQSNLTDRKREVFNQQIVHLLHGLTGEQ